MKRHASQQNSSSGTAGPMRCRASERSAWWRTPPIRTPGRGQQSRGRRRAGGSFGHLLCWRPRGAGAGPRLLWVVLLVVGRRSASCRAVALSREGTCPWSVGRWSLVRCVPLVRRDLVVVGPIRGPIARGGCSPRGAGSRRAPPRAHGGDIYVRAAPRVVCITRRVAVRKCANPPAARGSPAVHSPRDGASADGRPGPARDCRSWRDFSCFHANRPAL